LALKFQIDNYVLNVLPGDGIGNDYFSYVSLCSKVKGEFRLYNKCEIAKLIVRFGDEK